MFSGHKNTSRRAKTQLKNSIGTWAKLVKQGFEPWMHRSCGRDRTSKPQPYMPNVPDSQVLYRGSVYLETKYEYWDDHTGSSRSLRLALPDAQSPSLAMAS